MRLLSSVCLASLLVGTPATPGAEAPEAALGAEEAPAPADGVGVQSIEDRLLQAELLEVSAGDIEKALAGYRSILAGEKAPASVRARALLCTGRCQRKLGQLDAARKTLEDVVKTYPEERETLRQARSFLKELQTGKAENPEFDWLQDLQKNPEIQARVFDLAMRLASQDNKEVEISERQLLALGTLALPVIERLLETTRDLDLKIQLALMAVRMGRFERLALLMERGIPGQVCEDWRSRSSFETFLRQAAGLEAADKERLCGVLEKIPSSDESASFISLIRLWAGDVKDLPARLKSAEGARGLLTSDLLSSILRRESAAADEFAARLLDKSCALQARQAYLTALLEGAPDKVRKEHWALLEEIRANFNEYYLEKLQDLGKFDILAEIAPRNVQNTLQLFERLFFRTGKLPQAPAGWARVLRAIIPSEPNTAKYLHPLAEANDGAVPEFVGFLREREKAAPEYKGYGARRQKGWVPSAAYAEAMAGLLDSKDSIVLAIALEALALAPAKVGPDILPAAEKVLFSAADRHAQEFVVYALLRRLKDWPESGPAVAELLYKHCHQLGEISGDTGTLSSGLGSLGSVSHDHSPRRMSGKPAGFETRFYGPNFLGWAVDAAGDERLLDLLPHVLALPREESFKPCLEWFEAELPPASIERAVFSCLPSIQSPGAKSAVLPYLLRAVSRAKERQAPPLADVPGGMEFLRSAATDPKVEVANRWWTLKEVGAPAVQWFEWPKLFGSDDPILERLEDRFFVPEVTAWVRSLSEAEQAPIFNAAKTSRFWQVRLWRIKAYPEGRADLLAVLKEALDDPEGVVRDIALRRIVRIQGADRSKILIGLLEHPHAKATTELHMALRELAAPESIEPLVKMFKDPDPGARGLALETLNSIRKTLADRQEWEDLVRKMQKPDPKAPPE